MILFAVVAVGGLLVFGGLPTLWGIIQEALRKG